MFGVHAWLSACISCFGEVVRRSGTMDPCVGKVRQLEKAVAHKIKTPWRRVRLQSVWRRIHVEDCTICSVCHQLGKTVKQSPRGVWQGIAEVNDCYSLWKEEIASHKRFYRILCSEKKGEKKSHSCYPLDSTWWDLMSLVWRERGSYFIFSVICV